MKILSKFAVLSLLVWTPEVVWAQDTVAPTTGESTISARGEEAGDYNIVQSWNSAIGSRPWAATTANTAATSITATA